jgi:hypothetical protein
MTQRSSIYNDGSLDGAKFNLKDYSSFVNLSDKEIIYDNQNDCYEAYLVKPLDDHWFYVFRKRNDQNSKPIRVELIGNHITKELFCCISYDIWKPGDWVIEERHLSPNKIVAAAIRASTDFPTYNSVSYSCQQWINLFAEKLGLKGGWTAFGAAANLAFNSFAAWHSKNPFFVEQAMKPFME